MIYKRVSEFSQFYKLTDDYAITIEGDTVKGWLRDGDDLGLVIVRSANREKGQTPQDVAHNMTMRGLVFATI